MSTYRVPKCGRHFVKFDDVTIYPVPGCGPDWKTQLVPFSLFFWLVLPFRERKSGSRVSLKHCIVFTNVQHQMSLRFIFKMLQISASSLV